MYPTALHRLTSYIMTIVVRLHDYILAEGMALLTITIWKRYPSGKILSNVHSIATSMENYKVYMHHEKQELDGDGWHPTNKMRW